MKGLVWIAVKKTYNYVPLVGGFLCSKCQAKLNIISSMELYDIFKTEVGNGGDSDCENILSSCNIIGMKVWETTDEMEEQIQTNNLGRSWEGYYYVYLAQDVDCPEVQKKLKQNKERMQNLL